MSDFRACPDCEATVAAWRTYCDCGYVFKKQEAKRLEREAVRRSVRATVVDDRRGKEPKPLLAPMVVDDGGTSRRQSVTDDDQPMWLAERRDRVDRERQGRRRARDAEQDTRELAAAGRSLLVQAFLWLVGGSIVLAGIINMPLQTIAFCLVVIVLFGIRRRPS